MDNQNPELNNVGNQGENPTGGKPKKEPLRIRIKRRWDAFSASKRGRRIKRGLKIAAGGGAAVGIFELGRWSKKPQVIYIEHDVPEEEPAEAEQETEEPNEEVVEEESTEE